MLAIRVLGELELELDGQRRDPPARRSGRLLLAYLALRGGMHARADLAGLLWPDILESSARASLRSAIAAVRRALGGESERYLISSGGALGLADVTVDIKQFESLVEEGRLEVALDLCRGPLFQGLDADWIRQARAEQLDRLSDVLGELAQRAEDGGSLEQAIRYTRRQVALSPLAEPPNRALIRRLSATGDRASALAAYSDLAEGFRRELQTVPSLATRQVLEEARRGESTRRAPRIPLPPSLRALLAEPFVGRQTELESLRAALDPARRGEFRAVLVSGEPGIGKTALLAHLAAAALPHATVLLGRCRRPASKPLEPFAEALHHYAANTPIEQVPLLPQSSELAALVPEFGDEQPSGSPPSDLLPDGRRGARAIVDGLVSLSRDRPLVLLLDDLQEADRTIAEVTGQLLAVPATTPLLLVLSFRDTEAASPLLQRLASKVRALPGSSEISLRGLDTEAVAVLARSVGHDEVPSGEVSRLHSRTGGNPFYVTHLLASADALAHSTLPPRVHDLVWQEVERLGSGTQACLGVASVAGDGFELGTVASVLDYDDERALDALDEAVLAKVLLEVPSRVGRYQFRHDLIRESIYQRLTATRRAHLHRRLAYALIAQRAAGQPESLLPIVEHLRKARDLITSDELGEYLLLAAEEAEGKGTFGQAADFYEEHGESLAAQSVERGQALTALGHAARRAGQLDRARSAFAQAHSLASELGDEELQIAATLGLCSLPFIPGDRPVDPGLLDALESALSLAAASESAIRSQLLARLALEAFYERDRPRPDAIAEEAVAVAERSEDPRAIAAALSIGHLAFRGPDGPEERLTLARELAIRAQVANATELRVSGLLHQTVAEVELGRLGALEANASQVLELAGEVRQPAYGWWAYLWRATKAITTGQLEDGLALARQAHETGQVVFGPPAELELRAQHLWIALEQERFDEIREGLAAVEDAFAALPVWQALKARVLFATGDQDLAARAVAELSERGLATLQRDTNWLISAMLLSETAAQTGDLRAARELFTRLRGRAHHWAVSARGTVCLGPVSGALALLSVVLGVPDDAEHFYALARNECFAAGAEPAALRLERQYRVCVASTARPN